MARMVRCVAFACVVAMVGGPRSASARPNCGGPDQDPCPDPCLDEDPPPPRCPQHKPPIQGVVLPKYLILTVVYAPPGSAGSGEKSSVTYGSESSTGTTLKVGHGFKADVSFSVGLGLLGGLLKPSVNGEFTSSSSNETSVDVKKSVGQQIHVGGSSKDGIDHDADIIYLWLNPAVGIVARDKKAQWALGTTSGTMDIQYVYVGWLKNPTTMPPGVATRLTKAKIDSTDFTKILAADPFANGAAAIDTKRFTQTSLTLPYEPPFAQGESSPSMTLTLKDDSTTTKTASYESDNAVGFSVDAGPLADWLGLTMSTKSTFTWTSTSSFAASTGQSQSASCTVTGPAFGYTGPTDLAVYWDTLYGSFVFSPITDPPMVTGKVLDASGKPAARKEVLLIVNKTKKLRTYTNARGEYRFVGKLRGAASVSIDGQQRPVTMAEKPRKTLFKLQNWVEP